MKPVMVVGSINMDVFFTLPRMPEGGESIYCYDQMQAGGGKGANQALALHGLGIPTFFCGAVGRDDKGAALLSMFHGRGLDTGLILEKEAETGSAYILLEQTGENRIIVVPGANERLTVGDMKQRVLPVLEHCGLLLLQLEIPLEVIEFLLEKAAALGVPAVVDAGPIRGCSLKQLRRAWCISPNKSELAALTGRSPESEEELMEACQQILDAGPSCVLVKLGERGCFYMDRNRHFMTPAYSVWAVDTTAAGDSFTAGFVAGLRAGAAPQAAARLACQCGALAVTRKGAYPSLPAREDVNAFCRERGEQSILE
ncbi:MAG TPA: ribokinase [Lachnospiraceae bacterium]|nr:ribokinase [Lachnospiraceae bacterium]